jgi:hypothetical protein
VKNLARLALFLSLCFAVLFISAAGLRYVGLRIDWARVLPARPEAMLPEFISAARWALPFAVYFSILLGLSYSDRRLTGIPSFTNRRARKRPLFTPVAVIAIIVFILGFSFAVSLGLDRLGTMPPARDTQKPLGGPGLILMQGDNAIVLLGEPTDVRGPRAAAIPGRQLVYQEQPVGPDNSILSLPPVPFRDESPWFLKSIAIDFSLSARQFESRLREGVIPFLIYAGSVIFLLASLGFVLRLSHWPLANLFLGALAFRGILAAETFLNSPETQDLFASFLGNRFPLSWTVPLVFCFFGVLVDLYSILVYLAKRRADEED